MQIRPLAFRLISTILVSLPPHVASMEPPVLDAKTRARVSTRIIGLLQDNYVEPETAARISRVIRAQSKVGGLAQQNPGDFAGALSSILSRFDRHFNVSWSPVTESTAVDRHDSPEAKAVWREASRLQNYGFQSADILPGNIGYLDLRIFENPDAAGPTATAAMALLANADAMIVDLRENGGGEPEMVQLLCSYFFGPDPVHLNSLYWRRTGRTDEFWTLAEIPGKRIPDIPLYVLTSARTGSAAEEFAYNLQALKRALIIGRTTAGAANPGDYFDVGDGFSIFISTGKAINPVTGTNWEGRGVVPDVDIASDAALEEAQLRALQQLDSTNTNPTRQRVLKWAREDLELRRNPYIVSQADLNEFAGDYGNRRIRMDNGRLTYQREKRPVRIMVPVGPNLFLLDGVAGFRTRFETDDKGEIQRMVDMWVIGHEEVMSRE